jgi:hypothetical protein
VSDVAVVHNVDTMSDDFSFVDKVRLAKERNDLENEMKELKDTSGPRVRKGEVEEARRKASRSGTFRQSS